MQDVKLDRQAQKLTSCLQTALKGLMTHLHLGNIESLFLIWWLSTYTRIDWATKSSGIKLVQRQCGQHLRSATNTRLLLED